MKLLRIATLWCLYFATILFWSWLLHPRNKLLPEWAGFGACIIAGICIVGGFVVVAVMSVWEEGKV